MTSHIELLDQKHTENLMGRDRRIQELLEANNRYLERARTAEATLAALQASLESIYASPRIVRHKKRQTRYTVTGEAKAQVSYNVLAVDGDLPVRQIHDGDLLTVYRSLDDGTLHVRFSDEFEDGRFETI